MMLSLLNDFHYLSIFLHFCCHFFTWNFAHPTNLSILCLIHISKASNHQTSAFVIVHVSAAYSATLQIKHLIILFFSSKFILLVNSLFLSIKAFFAISVLLWMSFSQYPSCSIKLPRYLNCSTCSTICPSIQIFTFVFLSLLIHIAFVLFTLILYQISVWLCSDCP